MGRLGLLKDYSNIVLLRLVLEEFEMVFCGIYGIYIVMDYFNSCYFLKKMQDNDNIIEVILEKYKVLFKCDMIMEYCCFSYCFFFKV